jgi:hypothetical protein
MIQTSSSSSNESMTAKATPAADDNNEDASSSSNDTGMPFIFNRFFHSTNDFLIQIDYPTMTSSSDDDY